MFSTKRQQPQQLRQAPLSEQGGGQLLELLWKRGYFQEDEDDVQEEVVGDAKSVFRASPLVTSFAVDSDNHDTSCLIPSTDSCCYYNEKGLQGAVQVQLAALGGKAPLDAVLHERLHIQKGHWRRATQFLEKSRDIEVIGSGRTLILHSVYWPSFLKYLLEKIQHANDSTVSLALLVQESDLPLEVLQKHCLSAVTGNPLTDLGDGDDDSDQFLYYPIQHQGQACLCSKVHLQEKRRQILRELSAATKPILLLPLCRQHDWEENVSLAIHWIAQAVEDSTSIHGGLQGQDVPSKATFVPRLYTQQQELETLHSFESNGFLVHTQDGGWADLQSLIQTAHPDTFAVSWKGGGAMVARHVLDAAQGGLEESLSSNNNNNTIFSLADHLPPQLLDYPEALVSMTQEALQVPPSTLIVVLPPSQGLWMIPKSLVQEISAKILPPLIQSFAQKQAPIPDDQNNAGEEDGEGKKKSSKKSKRKNVSHSSTGNHDVVPILEVAGSLLENYPDLFPVSLEDQQNILLEHADDIFWEESEEGPSSAILSFCRAAFSLQELKRKCKTAVQAERKRLESLKASKTKLSRKNAAAQLRNVEQYFEEVFADGCYLVQCMYKFLTWADSSPLFEENHLDVLRNEFLGGCCAELTSRMTQYALFKNEEEGKIFSFRRPREGKDNNEESKGTFTSMDSCSHTITFDAYLNCPPPRDPLPVLRETLPGNQGISLARQWILCGGNSYRGGVKVDESSAAVFVRPGNADGFMRHLEENCLADCGLPFKKLDKKSEKQFLFKRRQQLTSMIHTSSDGKVLLDLTVMILLQQLRQFVVSGELLRGPLFEMLLQERKVSPEVATLLRDFRSTVVDGKHLEDDLLSAVKDLALCKDVAKYENVHQK